MRKTILPSGSAALSSFVIPGLSALTYTSNSAMTIRRWESIM